MKVTFQPVESPIRATGYANQTLGTLLVLNDTQEDLILYGETWQDVATFFGISIVDNTIESMPGELVFLFKGDRNSQHHLTSKRGVVDAGHVRKVDVRLKEEPGIAGSFKISLDENTYKITIE